MSGRHRNVASGTREHTKTELTARLQVAVRSGVAVTSSARRRGGDVSSSVAVIAVSDRRDGSAEAEALGAGANDFLAKPFGLAELSHELHERAEREGRTNSDVIRDAIRLYLEAS